MAKENFRVTLGIDKEPNAVNSAGYECVSLWAVQCLAQYVCLLCQHCTRFLHFFPPFIYYFFNFKAAAGREMAVAC